MKILWLGSLQRGYSQAGWTEAAFVWQQRLIRALRDIHIEILPYSILTRSPVHYWIDPAASPPDLLLYEDFPPASYRRYFSDPIRIASVLAQRHPDIAYILAYNFYYPLAQVALNLKKITGKPLIVIAADLIHPAVKAHHLREWLTLTHARFWQRKLTQVNAMVYLSYFAYQHYPLQTPKLHLDGIIGPVARQEPEITNPPRHFLYCGALSRWTGIEEFVQAFLRVQTTMPLQLTICGDGPLRQSLETIARQETSIKTLGYLSDEGLFREIAAADVLVNPRPTGVDSIYNFPSKLHLYLSFPKLVLSTTTQGIAPEYHDVMIPINPGDSLAMTQSIHAVTQMSRTQVVQKLEARAQLVATRNAHQIAQNFNRFLSTL